MTLKLVEPLQSKDRSLAVAVHISSIFWPLIGPLAGLVLTKKGSFAHSHSKQALLETIVINVALFCICLISITYTLWRISHFIQTHWVDFHWQEFVIRFIVGWILLVVLEIVNIAISLRQALHAWQGKWPKRYPQEISER